MDTPKYFRCPDGDVILFPDLVYSVGIYQEGASFLIELDHDTRWGVAKQTWERESKAEAIEVRDHLISILNLNIVN
jgi:hypothetical protein